KGALSGFLAFDDGSEDAHHGVMGASGHVGNLNAHGWRAAVGTAAVAGNTGNSQIVDVVAGSVFVDRKSTRLNSSHVKTSYAVCLALPVLRPFPTRRSSDLKAPSPVSWRLMTAARMPITA